MEMQLFYCYLKYQKDQKDSTLRKITRLTPIVIILLFLLIATTIISFIFTLRSSKCAFVPLSIELLLSLVTYFYSEHIQVKMSSVNLSAYKDRCRKNYEWLKEQEVVGQKEIQMYKDRITSSIENTQCKIDKSIDRIEKWLQILVIPIALAIFSYVLEERTDIQTVLAYAMTIVVIIVVIYPALLGLNRVKAFFELREIRKMKLFERDLQGVLDTQFAESCSISEESQPMVVC